MLWHTTWLDFPQDTTFLVACVATASQLANRLDWATVNLEKDACFKDVLWTAYSHPRHACRRILMDTNWIRCRTMTPNTLLTIPIENMWHELKEYIRREVKPHTKDELASIWNWRIVDINKYTMCNWTQRGSNRILIMHIQISYTSASWKCLITVTSKSPANR